jgi:hypothetical protein
MARTPGSLYKRWVKFTPKKRSDPAEWDDAFLDQTGKNNNVSMNQDEGVSPITHTNTR